MKHPAEAAAAAPSYRLVAPVLLKLSFGAVDKSEEGGVRMGGNAASKRHSAALWRTALLPKTAASSFTSMLMLAAFATPAVVRTQGLGASIVGSVPGAREPFVDSTLRTYYAKGVPFCGKPTPGHRSCFAMRRVQVSRSSPGAKPYTVRAMPGPGPAGGLTPAELATAYGYSTAGGRGETVAIVDAYNDPNVESDLGTFDSYYGLTPCTEANGCLKVASQAGSTEALPPDDTKGWSGEESLDVQAVRGVCPNCKILLVETDNDSNPSLDAGVKEAVVLGAKIVSNSYGGPESGYTAADVAAYNHPGVVITVASGDDGWDGWDQINTGGSSDNMPYAPASFNTVVAVGGTSLYLNQSGSRASEAVWNDDGAQDFYGSNLGLTGATGGGCSSLIDAKPWQSHVPDYGATMCGNKRLATDVAAVADPLTGFDIYDSYDPSGGGDPYGWVTVGGTSLASPIVAAMWALAGGADGASYPSLSLYGHLGTQSLYDVTVGGDGYCDGESVGECGLGNPNSFGYGMIDCDYRGTDSPGTTSPGTAQCDADPGYDGPSGVGTPTGLNAFRPAQYAVVKLPTTVALNTAETFSGAKSKDPYPGGTIRSYTWHWGDGSAPSTGVSSSHRYKTAGTFMITLSEIDSYGAKASTTVKVTVARP